MEWGVALEVALFLLWINFLPPLAKLVFGPRYDYPIDGYLLAGDGRPLLGRHKTWRGVAMGLAGSLLAAPLLPHHWLHSVAAAALSLLGDLATSCLKRRLDRPPGASILLFDHFLEGLLPVLYLYGTGDLSLAEGGIALLLFLVGGAWGARCWEYMQYQPSTDNSLRIIRSAVRVRQWRACHQPLVRWQTWLNFETFLYYQVFMDRIFRLLGLYGRGRRNVLAVGLREEEFILPSLPAAFDGYRILLMTDLHLDGNPGLTNRLIALVDGLTVDCCLIGGDIRMHLYGPIARSVRRLRRIVRTVAARDGCFGVLGNHDCIEMVPDLEDAGVVMLVNDSWPIRRDGDTIHLVGIDDPHFYKVHDLKMAFREVAPGDFSILLAHSPEAYDEAVPYGPALYLCGHTHGGQICLPGGYNLFTHCRAPRPLARGRWRYQGMTGYTSCGAGASGVPLRFHCPGEIVVLTLKRGHVT